MAGLMLAFHDEACAEALGDERLLAAMARFEAALARASARAGLIAAAEAETIARVCARARFDPAAIGREARRTGTLALPFVKSLTAQVAAVSPQAARWVHFGATSQDVMDTALVLCAREAAARILALGRRVGEALARLARAHAQTPTLARTLLQPAVPVTFGWKAAGWLAMQARAQGALRRAAREAAVLQFGGAGGTLAAYGEKAEAIAAALAEELDLAPAPIPWHSARDGIARLGAEAAILVGGLGKIARDLALLMQAEVGEAAEPAGAGRGGSSAMPHKRNPVGSAAALEAAGRAPALAATLLAQLAPEHERGLGQWQSQWWTLRDLLCAAASAAAAMAEALEGLVVDAHAMRTNLERTRGLVFAEQVALRLAAALGKAAAHALTERLCAQALAEGVTLAEALARDAQAAAIIPPEERARLFDSGAALGAAPAMLERALALWEKEAAC
jgi:3-carboxy-cis,cis-muconate cycloisomerase